MKRIMIRKSSGKIVPYDEERIKVTLQRSGAKPELVSRILKKVKSSLRPRITTDEIREIVRAELKKESPASSARYLLRSALARLGPAGFNFEKYVASILSAYGYKTQLPFELQGACVTHEVDVIAEKDGRRMFIEAKFRNNFNDVVNIKDTMATWARYLDLVDGASLDLCPHFDEAWIVTNARFTDHALKFAHCKNMVMIGWNHPKERTFARMVDLSSLYPLTILSDLSDNEIQLLAKNKYTLCREVTEAKINEIAEKTTISKKRLKEILTQCKEIIKTS